MFKELQFVVGDSSAFTMCLAVYVQVRPAPTSLPIFGCEISEASSPQFDPSVLARAVVSAIEAKDGDSALHGAVYKSQLEIVHMC